MEGIDKEVGPEVEIEQITKDETRARTQRETTDPDPDCRWLLAMQTLQRQALRGAQKTQNEVVGDEAYIKEEVFVVS